MYAKQTTVPVDKSRAEIEQVVSKYGATKFAIATDNDSRLVMIEFAVKNRRVRFELHQPPFVVVVVVGGVVVGGGVPAGATDGSGLLVGWFAPLGSWGAPIGLFTR